MRAKVLCVDDDAAVLKALAHVLSRDDLDIRTTVSPTEALAWLEREEFAVLVSDYNMPGMTGAQLAGQARVLRPETVRILLTGQHDLETAVDGINQGEIFRFVSKPFDFMALREILAAALERHRELVEISGDRVRRDRTKALRVALEQEYPQISVVNRDRDGRYPVADPHVLAEELDLDELAELLDRSRR
jgi:DNA-binding NtrC family response regulator